MFAIGDSLREARTRRGLSAADVQKDLRIRERYLTALEEEKWDLLPGEAYTKGFLRTYAEYLGLDGNLYMDEYNSRMTYSEEDRPIVPQSLVPGHRNRRGLLRTLGVLLVVAAAVASFAALGMGGGHPAVSGKTPALLPAKHVAKTTARAGTTPALATKPPVAQRAQTTVISAPRGRCWLSIRTGGPTGPVVYEGTLEQGKSLHLGLAHVLWVRMGAPSALDISLDGKRVAGLPASPANVLLTQSGAKSA